MDEIQEENVTQRYEGEEMVVDYDAPTPSNREIKIVPLDSGYLVHVGCQRAAVETTEKLLKALGEYLKDPVAYEKSWNQNKNRNKL